MTFNQWTRVMVKGQSEPSFTEWARFTLEGDAQRFADYTKESNPSWTVEVRYSWVTYAEDVA